MKLASFEAVIGALHHAEARCLIAGGMAVGAHGYLRFTRGVDLVVQLVPDNVGRVFSALRSLGYGPAVPVTAEQFADTGYGQSRGTEPDMQALAFRSDQHRETPVNLFAPKHFCFDDEYRRALVKPLHGAIAVRFVCIETLIRMKEATGRLADQADAEQLRLVREVDDPVELQPGEIDWRLTSWEGSRREQLRHWAALPIERAVESLEEMEELTERFREMRERGELHAALSRSSPAGEAHVPLVPAGNGLEDVSYGLEADHRALASAAERGTGPHPPQPDSPERGPEHGFRGRAGGPSDAGGGARPPWGAERTIETRFGVMTYRELAPNLARNVLELEERIEDGEFSSAALGERLVLEFHRLICGDLVPRLAGWRRIDVTVGSHTPPDFFKVPMLVREYGRDLQARLSAAGEADDLLLETLAFAEGRLLWIHPFADLNGRVTRVWLREILRRLDLPPVRLVPAGELDREEYFEALQAADRNEWGLLMAAWRRRFGEGTA